ncbi:MAG TPA: peptidoglycan DD-metalloendopeptidase family protein [Pseudomonadales bacterium]
MSRSTVKPGGFPRPHLILVAALSLFVAAVAFEQLSYDGDDRFSSEAVLVDLAPAHAGLGGPALAADDRPLTPATASLISLPDVLRPKLSSLGEETADAIADLPPPPEPASESPLARLPHEVASVEVKPGDNLSVIFQRQDIPARDLQLLLASEPLGKRLKNIFPGHTLTFTRTDDGTLLKLAYTPGPLETLEFERNGDGFVGRETFKEPTRTKAYKHGVIDHSLFVASQRAGLPDSLTMRLAQIFQWDVDFVLDIRQGDEFHVVYEELYVGNEFVGHGDILAAEFINRGDSYRAIRYTDSEGHADYYSPDGQSMRKAFLRAPVEFSRISSNFNLRRVHPLFKRNMPHRGIDYAAPTGTPVLASGDGRVVTASRSNPNGNYVVIQHGEQFTTKYLHLSKFGRGIKSGVRVRQGQVIGYVGSTGWASGPHLHYEFLVNGVHQNPRTVELPDALPIPPSERVRFDESAAPLLALLDDFKEQTQLAYGR